MDNREQLTVIIERKKAEGYDVKVMEGRVTDDDGEFVQYKRFYAIIDVHGNYADMKGNMTTAYANELEAWARWFVSLGIEYTIKDNNMDDSELIEAYDEAIELGNTELADQLYDEMADRAFALQRTEVDYWLEVTRLRAEIETWESNDPSMEI